MPLHRDDLPQLSGELFLTDGGLETTLVFEDGLDLPAFASFPLLESAWGRERLARYFAGYVRLAREQGCGTVLETPTWRANPDWGRELGYSPEALLDLDRRAVELVARVRAAAGEGPPVVISGCVGPRADGYAPGVLMEAEEARDYHRPQLEAFAGTEADLASAFTLNYVAEAVGIARAARDVGLPVVLSFTVETDGRLPTGTELGAAIEAVDEATDAAPAYYMINCAHPTHFTDVLDAGARWAPRLQGLRVNASALGHAELDDAAALDAGDPEELGDGVARARARAGHVHVVGGCCGTDPRHVAAIARACRAAGA